MVTSTSSTDPPSSKSPAAGAAVDAASTTTTAPRFREAQKNRTLVHPTLPQPRPPAEDASTVNEKMANDETPPNLQLLSSASHTFVVAADTQLGMANQNCGNWDSEIAYSQQAVRAINGLHPRPLFCCVCGDLVDMTSSIFAGKTKAVVVRS